MHRIQSDPFPFLPVVHAAVDLRFSRIFCAECPQDPERHGIRDTKAQLPILDREPVSKVHFVIVRIERTVCVFTVCQVFFFQTFQQIVEIFGAAAPYKPFF